MQQLQRMGVGSTTEEDTAHSGQITNSSYFSVDICAPFLSY